MVELPARKEEKEGSLAEDPYPHAVVLSQIQWEAEQHPAWLNHDVLHENLYILIQHSIYWYILVYTSIYLYILNDAYEY